MNRRFFSAALTGFVGGLLLGGLLIAGEQKTFEGKIVAASAKSVTVGDENDQHSFVFSNSTRITLDGNEAKWSDLHEGDSATVFAEQQGDTWVATAVAAYAAE